MIFWRKGLLDTLMQIFMMLRHLVAEISRFKFDGYGVIRTGASDLKNFGVVYMRVCAFGCCFMKRDITMIITVYLNKHVLIHDIADRQTRRFTEDCYCTHKLTQT